MEVLYGVHAKWVSLFLFSHNYLIFLIPNVFDPPVQYLQKEDTYFIYYRIIKVSMFSVLVLMEYITKPLFEALNVQL